MKRILTLVAFFLFSLASAGPLRLIVLVDEENYYWNNDVSSVSTGMTQAFLKEGFVVLDAAQLRTVKDRQLIVNALEGDLQSAIALATSFNADAIVIGEATADEALGVNLGPFSVKAYNGVANVRVIMASTGQVVAAVTGKATQSGLSGKEGERAALVAAGANAAQQLTTQLKAASGQKNGAALTRITIKGLNGFTDAMLIVKELQAAKGVTSVERRNFSGGVLELDLTAEFGADDVAGLLESLTLTKLTVTAVNNNAIDAKVK
ncbi:MULTISPECIES: CsgG/HfaB family protein [unclassified Deinococcus]|uniref:CsgG/HfaB family protein n=1 Tax=unclassified Deinococcus TaxID=2623546 RepID=UPI001C2F20C5|nr:MULTISPECIES: CsgG/HfaB family protein [unclassified Deinococcus]MDK2010985.1 CsgG/HfaB family protein [Deinococcus sp. 43]